MGRVVVTGVVAVGMEREGVGMGRKFFNRIYFLSAICVVLVTNF